MKMMMQETTRERARRLASLAVATGVVLTAAALPAQAQTKAEIGASLASLTVVFDNGENLTTFGVPTSGFGVFNPGVYLSLFVAPKFAIEPQLGLIVLSGGGDTSHVANMGAQAIYFVKGHAVSSPIVRITWVLP